MNLLRTRPSSATPTTDRQSECLRSSNSDTGNGAHRTEMGVRLASSRDGECARGFATTAGILGGAVTLSGLMILLSWVLDLDALRGFVPGVKEMKANTALGFAASGAALWALATKRGQWKCPLSACLALIPLTLGAGTLAEHLSGRDFGIDQLLATDAGPPHPGRMAAATASALTFGGAALLLTDICTRAAQSASLLALAVGLLGLLGHLFEAEALRGIEIYATMAPATALLIVASSLGCLLARPEAGVMQEFSSPMPGGRAARHLVLWSSPSLMAIGWLRLQGQSGGYYGTGFGLALMVALAIGTVVAAAWIAARSMNQAHRAVWQSESRYRGILDSAVDAIVIADATGRIVNLNPATERLFGYRREELIGEPVERLIPERFRERHREFRATYDRRELAGPMRERTLLGRRKDGSEFAAEISLSTQTFVDGHLITSIVRDVTQRRVYEEQLERQANYDSLTGLANRNLVNDRIQQGIQHAKRGQARMAVLFVDLDHFKVVNDSLGHRAGDELLLQAAQRLVACLREGDTVARMGGDEFVLLLPDLQQIDRAAEVMRRVADEMRKPITVGTQKLVVTCSIGASIYPRDGEDGESLLKHADAAMYRAKELGRNRFEFFTAEMNRRANERLTMESRLRGAIDNGELLLHYQPQIDLASGRFIGAEALLRWQHPELGQIPPTRFVPLAEETGLIIPIGQWVLTQTCAQQQAWRSAGLHTVPIAVNVSARQFREGDLVRQVRRALEDFRLDGSLLAVELTETEAMQEHEQVIAALASLKALGVRSALDDFGTGYSSLAYLQRFAIDKLKIDRSFVQHVDSDPNDAAIAATVIAMAHSLKLRVVAEGVETPQQLAFLRNHGCDEVQGFLFGRPLPPEGFASLLASGVSAPNAAGD